MRGDGGLRGLWGWQMCGDVGKLECWAGGMAVDLQKNGRCC
nr:MAG TPA: hypothetical protein [Caudoviricetes sp.]